MFQVEKERSREEEEERQQRVGDIGDRPTEAARKHQAQEEEEVQVSVDQSTLPCARGLCVRMLLNSAVTEARSADLPIVVMCPCKHS